MRTGRLVVGAFVLAGVILGPAQAQYVNFESSQVHPIALTPSGSKLLVVNTPDALLEVFTVTPAGGLVSSGSIPVGLEPVSVVARSDSEAWVVNHLSDTVSIVDLGLGATVRTLPVGDEPTDVVFANGRAFVAVSQEDAVKVFDLGNLANPPTPVPLFGSDTRALAASKDGTRVYAVVLNSGNQTTVVNANVIFNGGAGLDLNRLADLGLNRINCSAPHPPYPPLPAGIVRNPALTDPASGVPPVGLIVKWDPATQAWRDDASQDWSMCLPYRLPDHDLFVIDTTSLGVSTVDHLGTTLFEVSVNPGNGKIYIPNTEARNNVRFEHPLGVGGHVVDDRLTIVDPAAGNAATVVDLNSHIDRGSDPATNLPERLASLSQPGMLVWNRAGTIGYLTAIGSRKLFRVNGGCASGACIFGAARAAPDAVEVGEGPTGVALREDLGRAFVLNRFSNSVALVDTASLAKVGEVRLHDPSSDTIKTGRRFLYDGIDTSGHGDISCASCHISGNMDELGWDLGNPPGTFVPYGTPGDNVRFIVPQNNQPVTVPAQPPFSAHTGFDPQKGPMTTQTLRGMLEPLHWRGDRATLNAFNKAFVGLLGSHDIGPINNEPAGLTAAQMELFRQFALGITLPPNPYRNVDDTLPNAPVTIPGNPFTGNPVAGQALFLSGSTDAGQSCSACHALPFGAAGGKLGGLNPGDPVTMFAGLFNGNADGVPHSDLKVPHTRNLYEKFGPRFGPPGTTTPPDSKTGFGFIHDGSIPDLGTFLSAQVFTLTAQQVRDLTVFLMHFPTGIKPSVGRNLTVPAGPPPTGTPQQEQLVTTLIGLGNLADPGRHCDLVVYAPASGRLRTYFLNGGTGSGGLWTTDVASEAQVTTAALRQGATGPVTFLCATIGSGVRLGVDRDLDGHLNGEDCSPGDAAAPFLMPLEVAGLTVSAATPTHLAWSDEPSGTGPGLVYDLAGGGLAALHASGPGPSTSCLASDLASASYDDGRANPAVGDGYFYLTRGRNSCAAGPFGPVPQGIDSLTCP
jgi:DNA-binding beta-propeller fold protein YncE/mono/diheme cytochrome c family protein